MINLGIINLDLPFTTLFRSLITNYNTYTDQINQIQLLFEFMDLELSPDDQHPTPQVLLINLNGKDPRIVSRAKQLFPSSQIIVTSNRKDSKYVRDCFKNGCVSYIKSNEYTKFLLFTITITAQGGSFISPLACRTLVEETYEHKLQEDLLTARELQIARGIIDGLSYKMIADRHSISLDTVRVYVKRLYKKLNINSKGELFAQMAN